MRLGLGLGLSKSPVASAAASHTVMGDIVSSCVMDVDATVSDSYGGSGQTWANIETTPADSASQTDYDWFLGTDGTSDTTDPTFTGTAGDSGAYFNYDGGDFNNLASGANTTLLTNLHKASAGNAWTHIMCIRTPAAGFTLSNSILANMGAGASRRGIRYYIDSSGNIGFQTRGTSSNVTTNITTTLAADTDYMIAVGYDHDNTDIVYAVNSKTISTTNHTATGTDDASNPTRFGQLIGGGQTLESGFRVYGMYLFNTALTSGNLSDVVDELNLRHNRTYA